MKTEIVEITEDKLETLRDLSIQTFHETFAPFNTEEVLQEYYDTDFNLEQLAKDLADPESEYYFLLVDGEETGILKVNVGDAQTEQELENAFEIQRIYVKQGYQGLGLGKKLFDFAMERAYASGCDWAWLGVWEHNYKAQKFYAKYGFEKFTEHGFPMGDKVDIDWLLKKSLK